MKAKKFLTPKQKQLVLKKRYLTSFRRFVALEGDGGSVREHLDMNALELRNYIEPQLFHGMTWGNYRRDWCIDHIVALKYFDMFDEKEMKLCWNHNNLQPSWIMDNHAKGYCVEITEKILKGLPPSPIVTMLKNKIATVKKMFKPYYQINKSLE